MRLLIDGHLDLSWNALSWGRDITRDLDWLNRDEIGMTDHPAGAGHDNAAGDAHRGHRRLPGDPPGPGQAGNPPARGTHPAQPRFRQSGDRLGHGPGTTGLLRSAGAAWALADDPHGCRPRRTLEGVGSRWRRPADRLHIGHGSADPIVEPSQAVEWWNLGLRSVNLAHYGKSRYAVGTGDDGPLTREGVQLLKEFANLGMILDATHLSDTSFFQALDMYQGPVLASHNNCRAWFPTAGSSATSRSVS